jgi:hypothetical protein
MLERSVGAGMTRPPDESSDAICPDDKEHTDTDLRE